MTLVPSYEHSLRCSMTMQKCQKALPRSLFKYYDSEYWYRSLSTQVHEYVGSSFKQSRVTDSISLGNRRLRIKLCVITY